MNSMLELDVKQPKKKKKIAKDSHKPRNEKHIVLNWYGIGLTKHLTIKQTCALASNQKS